MTKKSNYDQFMKISYSGRRLLEEHSLSEEGVWEVYGEDPNCDLGGPHHEPFLGLYKGRLEDVIRLAVELPGFWQWGGGGRITMAGPKMRAKRVAKVGSKVEHRQRLLEQAEADRAELLDRIAKMEQELAELKKLV